MDDNTHQFQIETDRSLVTLGQAMKLMQDFGGNLRIFAFTMLRSSAHLFAEVHGIRDLEKAMKNILDDEKSRRCEKYDA